MSQSRRNKPEESAATRLGRRAGRLRRKLRESQPEVERAARSAARAARPAAERAGRFVREHQDEIKRAGAAGARAIARRATPPALHPVVSAIEEELSGEPPADSLVRSDRGVRVAEGNPPKDRPSAG